MESEGEFVVDKAINHPKGFALIKKHGIEGIIREEFLRIATVLVARRDSGKSLYWMNWDSDIEQTLLSALVPGKPILEGMYLYLRTQGFMKKPINGRTYNDVGHFVSSVTDSILKLVATRAASVRNAQRKWHIYVKAEVAKRKDISETQNGRVVSIHLAELADGENGRKAFIKDFGDITLDITLTPVTRDIIERVIQSYGETTKILSWEEDRDFCKQQVLVRICMLILKKQWGLSDDFFDIWIVVAGTSAIIVKEDEADSVMYRTLCSLTFPHVFNGLPKIILPDPFSLAMVLNPNP